MNLGLGSDAKECVKAFIDAMIEVVKEQELEESQQGNSQSLTSEEPISLDERRKFFEDNKTFEPFGQAWYAIATRKAVILSEQDPGDPQVFWDWIAEVNHCLHNTYQWQKSLADVFNLWDPGSPDALNKLKDSLMQINSPQSPPSSPPTQLKGKII